MTSELSIDPNDVNDFKFEDIINNHHHHTIYITDEEDNVSNVTDDLFSEKKDLQPINLTIMTKQENKKIVYQFIKTEININKTIPSGIKDICCLYSFIDIKYLFKDNPSWWTMFKLAKEECYKYNFLLSKEICIQFINNNHQQSCSFHCILGMIYSRMRLNNLAEIQYKKAIELKPENDVYLWNYSIFLKKLGRYKEAANLLKQAIDLESQDIAYKFEYGICLQYINNKEYIKQFEEITFILKMEGGQINKKYQIDAKNHLYKAVSFKILNDKNGMKNEYKRYLDRISYENLKENMTVFGKLLYFLEKYDEALFVFDKTILRERANSFTFFYYGLIMKDKGKYKMAKKWFEKALIYSKDFVLCQKELQLVNDNINYPETF